MPDRPPAEPDAASLVGDGAGLPQPSPAAWFADMIDHCLEYAGQARAAGRPVVGILCEYAPRELILAAGAVPVCLCGGSAKTIPAAEEYLPSNLCPLIKSTFGFHLLKKNPFLEMADWVVAETTCDGKKKMYELLSQDRPMYVLELPQKAGSPAARELWVREMRAFKSALEERYRTCITEEKLRAAVRLMNRERHLRRQLAALMKAEAPALTGRQLLDFKSSISGVPADFAQYERALQLYQAGAPPAGRRRRVRVLLTGVPVVHGAERVVEIIEDRGGLIVCQENCTGLKPILEDIDEQAPDLVAAIADKYFHLPCSVKTPNDARLALLRELCAEFRAQCVIDLTWQACLTYDIEAARVKRLVEQDLQLPYLHLQTDYAPADSARIAVRVEALFETVQAALQDGLTS